MRDARAAVANMSGVVANSPDDGVGVYTPTVNHFVRPRGDVGRPPFPASVDHPLEVLEDNEPASRTKFKGTVHMAMEGAELLPFGDGDFRRGEIILAQTNNHFLPPFAPAGAFYVSRLHYARRVARCI